MEANELIRVENMHKHFGPTIALNGFSFSVKKGEIKGLIGENGSGKSTVSSIIAGAQPPTEGTMYLRGEPYNPRSMMDAQEHGIAMIVQETGTIAGITVAENIFAGKEKRFRKAGFVRRGKMMREAKQALINVQVADLEPGTYIDRLSIEQKKLVELARAMYDRPELLIVDETTTALAERGRKILYELMGRMKEEGRSVLFISHDIDELMRICDSMVVLRDGSYVGELAREEYDAALIRKMLVGREVNEDYYRKDLVAAEPGEIVLQARNVTAGFVLKNVSLELYCGEVLGIGGLADSGMHDLGKALFGVEKVWNGSVKLTADNVTVDSPLTAIYHKMGYVSKDRDSEALILNAPIADNIALTGYHVIENHGVIQGKKLRKYVKGQIESLQIKCNSMRDAVDSLSGGNKQKVSFAKWMGNDTQILILDCPTRGVDVGVKAAMYRLIEQMRQEGKAILLISEELPELIGMSDRICIMKDGEIAAQFRRGPEVTETVLIDYMI